jgi:RNA polymerase sigma factor (sigma-70 family)
MQPIPSEPTQLVAHLFRHEAGRMVSVLTCMLGFDKLELAEDIVQDTMVMALKSWPFNGIPDNPSAWLHRVAKNRALDLVRREATLQKINTELARDAGLTGMDEPIFHEDAFTDSQLRMLFACCHPSVSFDAQVTLCLKILGGLSVREIANAFLTTEETITKRLYRAKEKLRAESAVMVVPTGFQLANRLDAVLQSIYLLFNEGYTSSHPDLLIRRDLSAEAMRLCLLLTDYPGTAKPQTYALLALFCFQAARFDARLDNGGAIVLLPDQDRTQWDQALIRRGRQYLSLSAQGEVLSAYHLEAGIALLHSLSPSFEQTNWPAILQYYDLLYAQKPSPVVALNRAVALAQVGQVHEALQAVLLLNTLTNSHYYHAILGDLYQKEGQLELAKHHYSEALALTNSKAEQALLSRKRDEL